jgi:hypothetical protein
MNDEIITEMQERHRANAVWLTEATDRALASVREASLVANLDYHTKGALQDVMEMVILTNTALLDSYERLETRLKELEEKK